MTIICNISDYPYVTGLCKRLDISYSHEQFTDKTNGKKKYRFGLDCDDGLLKSSVKAELEKTSPTIRIQS